MINENVKLYQGDCLEVMDKLIAEGVKVDLILTDPPYKHEKEVGVKCYWVNLWTDKSLIC